MTPTPPSGFATLVRDFFCRRLIDQQDVSPRTVAAYRDTFRLLLAYFAERLAPAPGRLSPGGPGRPDRPGLPGPPGDRRAAIGPRTRNARLAACGPFVQYAAARDPTAWPLARRVLAIPTKRFDRPLLGYLTREEMEAVLAAPDGATWSGQRDRVLFALMYNTGARVSEAIGLRRERPDRGRRADGPHPRQGPEGAGRAAVEADGRGLARWLKRLDDRAGWSALPERPRPAAAAVGGRGPAGPRCREGRRSPVRASGTKPVSPHTIRHTTAMHLLQSGVDLTVIALWLGHESPETTHQYVEADLEMKEEVLTKAKGLPPEPARFHRRESCWNSSTGCDRIMRSR